MNSKEIEKKHISVLLNELVDNIEIYADKKNTIVDCTLGMGGHATEIIKKMNPGDTFIGFDADERNLKLATLRLNEANKDNKVELILIHSNFVHIKEELEKRSLSNITGIYYDLGLSSLHVDEADRGFSFRENGPLDMRFDANSGKPASFIVNVYRKEQLIEIFRDYGEESQAEKIASAICNKRKKDKFETTNDLVEIIETVSTHPKVKTKIFQALRIATNKELDYAQQSIEDAIGLLAENGHIFVISFHSLEDRLVKQIFKKESRDCICDDFICSCHHKKSLKILNKKPILPSPEEIKQNSRSRSAKGRVARKITNNM
ncbi:MAG: 16S rRNA (cytosine(1402)-N(4))-methyltransferase RsmH [Candidatus Gracilibacteria bacterium]|nr:16S rRNA (cytosine(1402)-N(4))-methyltransferase RsmH [Candidatus Gracilibacteria bacterium]